MTPLQLITDPVTLTIIGLYVALILTEALFPARKLPHVNKWKIKGIVSFLVFLFLSSYLPYWYEQYLPAKQLLDLKEMNVVLAATLGILLYEFGVYVWHRSMHNSGLLWRIFHQMHHSAERLDTFGAFYFSPFDVAGFTVVGTVCFSFIMGLPAQAVTIILLVTNFLVIFQHANIRTPVWLGYLIQRPESHALHHARDIHAYNYCDLPVYDILFRTFRNPKEYVQRTGFYDGASERVGEMLSFQDVSKQPSSTTNEQERTA